MKKKDYKPNGLIWVHTETRDTHTHTHKLMQILADHRDPSDDAIIVNEYPHTGAIEIPDDDGLVWRHNDTGHERVFFLDHLHSLFAGNSYQLRPRILSYTYIMKLIS